MELLTRWVVLAWVAALGCAPKPLVFLDATTDGDTAADARDEADTASPDAPGDAADATDGEVSTDVVRDAPAGDREVVVPAPTSCAGDPGREDCRVVAVDDPRTFCLGTAPTAANTAWNASPPLCGLSLSPYAVDAYEVTVARFRVFSARWVARELPSALDARFANGLVFRAPLPPRTAASEWSPSALGCTWTDAPSGDRERQPINCVGWALAMYFCAWEGGHLLTSTQYEHLARWRGATTAEGRAFPWGDEAPSCALAQYQPCAGDDGLRTRRVGALARGAAGGVFDLAGNVADLVADDFATYDALRANGCWTRSARDPLCLPTLTGDHYARGGSGQNASEVLLRAVFRPSSAVLDASPARGFRCAYRLP